ncbi:MAG: AAA family ATPase, partial [Spirochaetaceae bacterium]|nr:AAA family ATPase [Spirochaetaceae bacterium]
MKILNLRFENINSLAGEWKIDFTDPAFDDGIFILHGPTGAGKTTILDAICLALYGKTSRQSSFNKTQNEVMTKGSASCFAQAEFESGGKRYRAFWEHKKSKTGNSFQASCTRRLYQIGEEEVVLAEKTGELNEKLAAVTGMDFDQFTSAALLPQGKFDAFLNAEKKQRSEILEKISRTRIYSDIGAAVHERKGKEDASLVSLKDKISEIKVLSESEKADLLERKQHGQVLLNEKKSELEKIEKQLKLYDERSKILRDIAALDKKKEALQKTAENEKERFSYLEQAKKAVSIADTVMRFDRARTEKERLESEIQEIKTNVDTAKRNHAGLLPEREGAARERETAEKELTESEPRIKRARELDVLITETRKNMNNNVEKINALIKDNDALNKDFNALAEKNIRLKENAAALKAQAEALKNEIAENRKKQEAVLEAVAALSAFSSTSSFDDNRRRLRDGEPCPLCGSPEHPFCNDEAGLHEKQEKLRNLNQENAGLKRAITEAERALEEAEARCSRLEAELSGFEARQAANRSTAEANDRLVAGLQGEAAACEKQAAVLAKERGELVSAADIDGVEQHLRLRRDSATTSLEKIDKKLSEYASYAENFTKLLQEKETDLESLLVVFDENRKGVEVDFVSQGFDSRETWEHFNWGMEKITEIERVKIGLEADLKNLEEQKAKLSGDLREIPTFSG